MIVGNGLVAKAFSRCSIEDNVLIFASGVSSSIVVDNGAFVRERDLIKSTVEKFPDAAFVYLSTCDVYVESKLELPYVKHKILMEDLVYQISKQPYVFRVSNLIGAGGNKNSVINYFLNNIKNGNPFDVYEGAERNFIDVDDAAQIILAHVHSGLSEHRQPINIAAPMNTPITELVRLGEAMIGKKAKIRFVKGRGGSYSIDVSKTLSILESLDIRFDSEYMHRTLQKYFSV